MLEDGSVEKEREGKCGGSAKPSAYAKVGITANLLEDETTSHGEMHVVYPPDSYHFHSLRWTARSNGNPTPGSIEISDYKSPLDGNGRGGSAYVVRHCEGIDIPPEVVAKYFAKPIATAVEYMRRLGTKRIDISDYKLQLNGCVEDWERMWRDLRDAIEIEALKSSPEVVVKDKIVG